MCFFLFSLGYEYVFNVDFIERRCNNIQCSRAGESSVTIAKALDMKIRTTIRGVTTSVICKIISIQIS